MSRIVRAGLIQASTALSGAQPLERIKKAMIEKHLKLIDQAQEQSSGPLSPGAVLRTVFLRRAEHALVRVDRARARWPDYKADAEDRGETSHGDRSAGLRKRDDR